jgi:hypothetical protein
LALPRYDHIIERRAVAFEVDVLDEEPVEHPNGRTVFS